MKILFIHSSRKLLGVFFVRWRGFYPEQVLRKDVQTRYFKQIVFNYLHFVLFLLFLSKSFFYFKEQRKVASVKVVLSSVLQSSKQSSEMMKLQEINQTIEQIVTPHNDFFSAQFLIPFIVLGIHVVCFTFSIQSFN